MLTASAPWPIFHHDNNEPIKPFKNVTLAVIVETFEM